MSAALPFPQPDPPDGVPDFNGKPVARTNLSITSVGRLECDDTVIDIDQIVRLTVEGRVTEVRHVVNEKTGELERHQRVKAIDVEFTPWDPNDPSDRGIIG